MNDAPAPSPPDAATHPPLAPSRTLKTPRPPKAVELLDDRGRPVVLAELATLRQAVYERTPPFPWRRVISWTVLIAAGAWFVLSMFKAVSVSFPLGLIGLLGFVVPAATWRRGGKAATAKDDRVSCASLVRSGRCGGCGFSLRELNRDADGCVACPECGAAWNRDRWDAPPKDAHTLATRSIETNAKAGPVDDRGALIPNSLQWEPDWCGGLFGRYTRDSIEPGHWKAFSEFHAACEAQLHRLRARAGLWVLGGTCVAMGVLASSGSTSRDGVAYVIAALLAMLVLVITVAVVQGMVDTRGTALKHGLCPACGELLDLSQPRQFDGCIQCAKCAAAWKVDATPRETPTDSARTTGASQPALQPALQPAAPESPKEPARG